MGLNDVLKDIEDLRDLAQGVLNAATDEDLRAACEARGWTIPGSAVTVTSEPKLYGGIFGMIWEQIEDKVPQEVKEDIGLETDLVVRDFRAEPGRGEPTTLTMGEEFKCLAMALSKVAPTQAGVKYAPFPGADSSRQKSLAGILFDLSYLCQTLAEAGGCFREPLKPGADPNADPNWDHGSHTP